MNADNLSKNSSISTAHSTTFDAESGFNLQPSLGLADENGHSYNDYKEYFGIANLNPSQNYKSKNCRKAAKQFLDTEKKVNKIRNDYKKDLDKINKNFKKVEKKLINKYKDNGFEFFKKYSGGFYSIDEVKEHRSKLKAIQGEMDSKIGKIEKDFLDKMNKNKKNNQVIDVMKRNDTYLFIDAQRRGVENPENYTISNRKNAMLNGQNGGLNIAEALKQYFGAKKEKNKQQEMSLWGIIKQAIKDYLLGPDKNNQGKGEGLEMEMNGLLNWLDKKHQNNKEATFGELMNKLMTQVVDKQVKADVGVFLNRDEIDKQVNGNEYIQSINSEKLSQMKEERASVSTRSQSKDLLLGSALQEMNNSKKTEIKENQEMPLDNVSNISADKSKSNSNEEDKMTTIMNAIQGVQAQINKMQDQMEGKKNEIPEEKYQTANKSKNITENLDNKKTIDLEDMEISEKIVQYNTKSPNKLNTLNIINIQDKGNNNDIKSQSIISEKGIAQQTGTSIGG